MTTDEILLKHYDIQQTALNEIKEMIACREATTFIEMEELIQNIEDVAAYASQVDLTNPHSILESRKFIAELPYDENWDILHHCKKR